MNPADPRFHIIVLTGRLVTDPELRQLPSGDLVCTIRIAVDGMRRNRETGYVKVTSFGKPGEAAARVLTRGWLVNVVGRLQEEAWTTQDGQNRTSHSVVGSIEFLAAPKSASGYDEHEEAAYQAAIEADGAE